MRRLPHLLLMLCIAAGTYASAVSDVYAAPGSGSARPAQESTAPASDGLLSAPASAPGIAASTPPPPEEADLHVSPISRRKNWIHQLRKGNFDMDDPDTDYPRFIRFCMDVYKWGDRTFNTYDTTYVVGFGRNWKTRILLDGWTDSYNMHLSRAHQDRLPVTFISDPYINSALALQFMAVGFTYGVDLNNIFFNKPVSHQKFEFGFNCARFNLEISLNNNHGGSILRRFGDYNKGRPFYQFMSGVQLYSLTSSIYYFFNNFKYANGAAYNFSKRQKKSAGSAILGVMYAYEDFQFDFNTLPDYLDPYFHLTDKFFRVHYYSYNILAGYGYNWVISPRFLFNATLLPSLGMIWAYEDSYDGARNLLAMNLNAKMSLTYNKGDFFVCFIGRFDGKWYRSKTLSVLSSVENFSLSVGVRF